ncbi:MAG: ABC transporter substrate-binding protein, partial [Mycobacterium sp.]
MAGAAALSACSGSAVDQIDYAVDGALVSYNTTTVTGAASAGAQAFARTLTGFGYHGPDGQVVADRDFGSISVVGRAPLVLDYQIAEAAVYSDGAPITCDDLVLAWAAQSGRFPGFDAASRAGYADIDGIDCQAGQKKARVSFAQDRNIVDYQQLFTATSMMPSHVIANELGANVTEALLGNNVPVVEKIAQAWNSTWELKKDLKPDTVTKHFPSSGPYKLESVLDGGAVVLVANDRWWGAKAVTKRITVWPQAADIQDRVNKRTVDVVDVATGSAGSLVTPDDYQSTDSPSGGIEQLIFAPHGPLSETPARRAVALCTPRDAIAHDAGVPVANSRLNTAADDAFDQAENAPEAGQFAHADPGAARDALGG